MGLFDFLMGTGNFASAPVATSSVEELVAAVITPPSRQTTQQVIDEIHNTFYNASDKLLAEAQAVIAGTDESSFAKAERLKKLGFGQARGVQEVEAEKAKLAAHKQTQELLLSYSLKYPTYRFIDEAGIEAICAKYSLVFGSIKDYKGFVPEKNLAEIEAFPGVKAEDMVFEMRHHFTSGGMFGDPIEHHYGSWRTDHQTEQYHQQKQGMMAASLEAHRIHFMMKKNAFVRAGDYDYRSSKDFMICAPVKDMNMDGKELDGHRVVNKHIPDPVVLVPLRGGLWCILTAWGDEQHDPLVQKQGLN